MEPSDFWLASGSPRRRELLTQVGYRFDVMSVDIDEEPLASETPKAYVERLALEKAATGAALVTDHKPVLGADTTVTIDGFILAKPSDEQDFRRMMALLSGREHSVYTGVAVSDGERSEVACSETRVRFAPLADDDIARYWASGEPLGKAGGYAIQGFGAVFVAGLAGSYSGVVGLPLFETRQLLSTFNIEPWNSDNNA